jgi:hypothetical protein
MNFTGYLSRLCVCALALTCYAAAETPSSTFHFSGVITQITNSLDFDETMYEDQGFQVGDAFTGTLFYQLTLQDIDPDPESGSYYMGVGTMSDQLWLEAVVRGVTYRSAVVYTMINVRNTSAGDSIWARGDGPGPGGYCTLTLHLADSTGAALASDALPLDIVASQWETGAFGLLFYFGPHLHGEVLVPEPRTVSLLGLGAFGLFVARGKKNEKIATKGAVLET